MQKIRILERAVVFVLVCAAITEAEVRLPAIFGDRMVLQQESPVTIWGWAEPGKKIDVKGSWQGLKADADGGLAARDGRTARVFVPHRRLAVTVNSETG